MWCKIHCHNLTRWDIRHVGIGLYLQSDDNILLFLFVCSFLAVHEKLFIIFMISSLTHMLTCIKGMRAILNTGSTVHIYKALQLKQTLFNISLISTIGLVGFFLEHRLLCHRMGKNVLNCFFFVGIEILLILVVLITITNSLARSMFWKHQYSSN